MMERTPWGKHALVSSLFFILGAETFLLSPLIPLLADDFAVGVATAALSVSTFALAYAVASPLAGALGDGNTRKVAILRGASLFALGDAVCALAPSFSLLIAGRVIAGIGGALMGPAIWAYVTESAAPGQRGRAVSRVAAFFAAGQVVGVPTGAVIAELLGWRAVFATVAGGLLVAAALVYLRLGDETRVPPRDKRFWQAIGASLRLWTNGRFAAVVSANFFAQAARNATYAFAGALFLLRFGFGTAQLGWVGAIVGASSLAGALVSGGLVDRLRRYGKTPLRLNVLYGAAMSAGLVAATGSDLIGVSIGGFVLAFAAGSGFISTSQEVLTSAMGDMRAPAVSWNNSALYAGTATGVFLLGFTALGSVWFTVVSVAMAVAATAISLMIVRRRA
jgi:DHA1 family inner membrane transport protein